VVLVAISLVGDLFGNELVDVLLQSAPRENSPSRRSSCPCKRR
jgi:hypothetical protein